MKISLKWLNDFVEILDYSHKPEALAELLTKAGLEVEEILEKSKHYQCVVTGLLLEKDKHPQADKLSVCKVMTQEGVVHQIVCGAQNHKANDKVVLALPGAVLPGGITINKTILRGIESAGMLCSKKELGLSEDELSQGIMILPEDAPIGKDFAEYMGLDDVIFELKVTPNRADCLSHFGLAREIGALLGRPMITPSPFFKLGNGSTKSLISLEINEPERCPRYAGRYIRGVKIGKSPEWMVQRLEGIGLRSINNVVDITNYVMMELGQPLHAFDADQLQSKKIVVERAQEREVFVTLYDKTITLTGQELMIKDGKRSIAMAGVIGGMSSGVTENTQNIFLEAAYFHPSAVRKASRTHGLNTDSAYRFSRGVDPEAVLKAMNRAAELIVKYAEGEAFGDHHDVYTNKVKKRSITISQKKISESLGYLAESRKFADYMQRLGCEVLPLGPKNETPTEWEITPPSFRFDLEDKMDLVEEYARLNGYEQITESLPSFVGAPTPHDELFLFQQKISQTLVGQGYSQALNFSFVSEKGEEDFLQNRENIRKTGLSTSPFSIKLLNPLSDELNVMRSSLAYSLYKNVVLNYHQGNENGRLFEIGKTFHRDGKGDIKEQWRLGFVAWGSFSHLWDQKNIQAPWVFVLKGLLENLFEKLQLYPFDWIQGKEKEDLLSFLHPGQQAKLKVREKNLGWIGTLHPRWREKEKIRCDVALAEVAFEKLNSYQISTIKYEPLVRLPCVVRDLALIMDKNLPASFVVNEIKGRSGPLLKKVEVFDSYEGSQIDSSKKSLAFRLEFQDKNATLQDLAINQLVESVLLDLKEKFSIIVR